MSKREGYRWFRNTWRPSAAQQRVLDELGAGRTNAEIAVRLDLSPETVKWHVSQLLAETGCADRQALVRWWQARQHDARHALAPLLPAAARFAIAGLALTLAVAVLGNVVRRVVLHSEAPPGASRTIQVDRGFHDAGRLVEAPSETMQVENRADRAVVFLSAGGVLHAGIFGPGCGPPCLPRLRGSVSVDGQVLAVQILTTTAQPTEFDNLGAGRVQVSAPLGEGGAPTVMVTAADGDGARHRVVIDDRGHLLIAPNPLPGDMVIDYPTGEQLDVAGMRHLGRLAPLRRMPWGEFAFTTCDGSACRLSYNVVRLVAPMDGAARCLPDDQGIEMEGGGVRLQFIPISGFAVPTCVNRPAVVAGDLLADYNAHFLVSAVSTTGEVLSLVVANDGTLYIGRTAPSASCPPCLWGS